MNTLITIGYQAILFEGVPANLFEALAKAKLVDVSGYGKDRVFKPADKEILVELIPEEVLADDRPVLKALHDAEARTSEEISKRYRVESELQKLKKQFGLEEVK